MDDALQQEIAQAADGAVRKYHEVTPTHEKNDEQVANTMRAGARERTSKLNMKMMKLVTLVDPIHRPEFLKEVNYIFFQCSNKNAL